MYGEMFLSWLPVIPASMLVLFFFIAGFTIVRALTVPPGFEKKFDGQCGACGYVIGTLIAQQCPECGCDLLKAGVITRRMFIRLRGSTAMAIAAWTVLVFSVAGTVLAVWGVDITANKMNRGIAPGGYQYVNIATYGPHTSWDSEARQVVGETFKVNIELTTDQMNPTVINDVVIILVLPDETEQQIVLSPDDTWVLKGKDEKEVQSGEVFSSQAIDALFVLGGFDIEDETIRSYSGQLHLLLDKANNDIRGLQQTGVSALARVQKDIDEKMHLTHYGWSSRSVSTTPAVMGIAVLPPLSFEEWSPVLYWYLGLLFVYVLGIVGIVWRRRSLLRKGRYVHPKAQKQCN